MKLCLGCMNSIDDHAEKCPYCGFNERTYKQDSVYLTPGSILNKHYIVGRFITNTGYSVRYIGYDAERRRKVYINEYLPSDFSTRSEGDPELTIYSGGAYEQFEKGLKSFLTDAVKLGKAGNVPGLACIYDCFKENSTGYFVTGYQEGYKLSELIAKKQRFSLNDVLVLMRELLTGLSIAHNAGVLHLDISPEAVFITKDMHAVLIDFASARYVTSMNSKSLAVILKQGYAAAEQYRTSGEKGTWTDVYALGAVMYKLLTGITPADAMDRALMDKLADPSSVNPDIPQNIENALMNALVVPHAKRTQTADRFLQELGSEKVKRIKVRKNNNATGKVPVTVKILAAAAVAAVVVGGIFVVRNLTDRQTGTKTEVAVITLKNGMPFEDFKKDWEKKVKKEGGKNYQFDDYVNVEYRYDSFNGEKDKKEKIMYFNDDTDERVYSSGEIYVKDVENYLKGKSSKDAKNEFKIVVKSPDKFSFKKAWIKNYSYKKNIKAEDGDGKPGAAPILDRKNDDEPYGTIEKITIKGKGTYTYENNKLIKNGKELEEGTVLSKEDKVTIYNGDYFKVLVGDNPGVSDKKDYKGKNIKEVHARKFNSKNHKLVDAKLGSAYYDSDYISFNNDEYKDGTIVDIEKEGWTKNTYSSKDGPKAFYVVKEFIKPREKTLGEFLSSELGNSRLRNSVTVYDSDGNKVSVNEAERALITDVRAQGKCCSLTKDAQVFSIKKDGSLTITVDYSKAEKEAGSEAAKKGGSGSGRNSGTGTEENSGTAGGFGNKNTSETVSTPVPANNSGTGNDTENSNTDTGNGTQKENSSDENVGSQDDGSDSTNQSGNKLNLK